eukprot:12766932-Ditylum_brightwellii.AAC.1
MMLRTLGAISLGQEGNLQGGYKFFHLSTGKKISRRLFTELPIPYKVILRVEELAIQAGKFEELSFGDRNNYMYEVDEWEEDESNDNASMPLLKSRSNITSSS